MFSLKHFGSTLKLKVKILVNIILNFLVGFYLTIWLYGTRCKNVEKCLKKIKITISLKILVTDLTQILCQQKKVKRSTYVDCIIIIQLSTAEVVGLVTVGLLPQFERLINIRLYWWTTWVNTVFIAFGFRCKSCNSPHTFPHGICNLSNLDQKCR